jgi:YD repeat-containing protein
MENAKDKRAEIGVLGTGRMGQRLAAMFASAGRNVILGSRDSAKAVEIAEALASPTLRGGSNAEAARAPAVLPAIFIRDGLLEGVLRPASPPVSLGYQDGGLLASSADGLGTRRFTYDGAGRLIRVE